MEIIEPYGFIYITTNMVNGKKYIGQRKFSCGWKNYIGSGKILKQAIKKYGKKSFCRNIIAIAYNQDELDDLEIDFINNHNAVESDDYYNIATGGIGNTNIKPWNKNKTDVYTEETLKKMSESRKGKYVGEENYFYGKHFSGKLHPMYGKHHTKKSRRKISNSRKGKNVGKNNHNAVKIICITTEEVFNTMIEASEFYNIKSSSNIGVVCRGERKTCGKLPDGTKLEWMYYDEYLEQIKKAS